MEAWQSNLAKKSHIGHPGCFSCMSSSKHFMYGTSIYLTRDSTIDQYQEYKFDKMVYVVSAQWDMHLQQSFKVLDLTGFDWADGLEYVNYGLVMGMSTRKGTVVLLSNLIW
jgi:arginyl-tRNA synthetase